MPVIDVRRLHYAVRPHFYSRPHSLVENLTFAVEAGEIFGFLGPNGAGKTTTIKILLNLLAPQRGEVLLMGQPCREPLARQQIGFLPERAFYPPHLSAYEFVLGHALLCGLQLRAAKLRTWTVLEQVGVGTAAKQRLSTYSKGMLQRTGLAQALVGNPAVVILDEPMSGLDPLGRWDVREIMLSLKAQGKTVFFSTHILPDVELICDRVAILVQGKLRRIGTLRDLLAEHRGGVEVDVESLDAAGVTAGVAISRQHRAHAAGHTFAVDSLLQANVLVDTLRARGGQICRMQSGRSGLESLFVNEARL